MKHIQDVTFLTISGARRKFGDEPEKVEDIAAS
jgi:hypothetical protein